jgi:hypothetical protein
MTPEQLRDIGERLYGNWGWQTRMAETLKVDGSTVRRWLSGKVVIPGPAEVALTLLLKEALLNTENNENS